MLTAPNYGSNNIPVFYIANGDNILSSSDFVLTFNPTDWSRHSGGRDYPEKIAINVVQKEVQTKILITSPVFIETRNLLENLSWPIKSVTRLFTKPYYFRFNADFHLKILENNETTEKNGSGIFEMMMLKGLQTVRE